MWRDLNRKDARTRSFFYTEARRTQRGAEGRRGLVMTLLLQGGVRNRNEVEIAGGKLRRFPQIS